MIGLRAAPRGPACRRFWEQLLDLLLEDGLSAPLTVVYARSISVLDSAATTTSAAGEPVSHADAARARTHARFHTERDVDPMSVVAAGLRALDQVRPVSPTTLRTGTGRMSRNQRERPIDRMPMLTRSRHPSAQRSR